jgi:SAM-dependent methyltransferase
VDRIKESSEERDKRQRFIRALESRRPERRAGGFSRDDGTVAFFSRVNSLLSERSIVLDFGAGRGRQFDVPDPGYAQELQRFQGRVDKVVGIDVYEGVLEHPFLDERFIVQPGAKLPLHSSSIDVVVADWVLEHIDDPAQFASEMERILKPGGWICARTVNKWGYVAIGARLVPDRLHAALLGRLVPMGKDSDVFRTRHRLNTVRSLDRYFSKEIWTNCSYVTNSTPRYFGRSAAMLTMFDWIHWWTPPWAGTDLYVFLRKGPVTSKP